MFKAWAEREESRVEETKRTIYLQAVITAGMVSSMISGHTPPSYEDIFEADTEEYKLKQAQNLTEQLKNFAEHANEQRRRNGRRETES